MSRWLWISACALLWAEGTLHSFAAEPATQPENGGTSKEEEVLLWTDGSTAYQQEQWPQCIRNFDRYVSRYPTSAHSLQAHLYLGTCYLRSGDAPKALDPLKYYVDASRFTAEGISARLQLARAELAVDKPQEALLLVQELLKTPLKDDPTPSLTIEALLIKTRSYLALRKDSDADRTIRAFFKEESKAPIDATAWGEGRYLEIVLKTRNCNAHPPAETPLDEGPLRAHFKERAQCLEEALLMLKKMRSGNEVSGWPTQAQALWTDAYKLYGARMSTELPPTKTPRTKTERKKYEEELRVVLKKDFEAFRSRVSESLKQWKAETPASTSWIQPLESTVKEQ
jgi:tetratricopeptide (TPR) repeat protein